MVPKSGPRGDGRAALIGALGTLLGLFGTAGCGRIGYHPFGLGSSSDSSSNGPTDADVMPSDAASANAKADANASGSDAAMIIPHPDARAPDQDASKSGSGGSGSVLDAGADARAVPSDAGDVLGGLDDGFTSGTLGPEWTLLNSDHATASVAGGDLVVTPILPGQWYMGDHAGAVVTSVTGDFVVTAQISVVYAANPSTPLAGPGLELGGIIARNPVSVSGNENHVWIAVGANGGAPSKESKSTLDSVSTYVIEAYAESRATVRICRIGSTFRTYHSPFTGGAWTPHQTFDRPDLPTTVEVGPFSSDQTTPIDIATHVGFINFRRPSSVADCTAP
jgi:hypothetical protein